jgi:anti-anti-sigma factor
MLPIEDTPQLGFEISGPSDGAVVVRVDGEVDTATAPALEARLRQVIVDGVTSVELDLTAVGFIDSSGLRALIVARQLADGVGCALGIEATSPAVARILDVTGLTEHFARA